MQGQQLTPSVVGTTQLTTGLPADPTPGVWEPSDQGLLAWVGDPANFVNTTALSTQGRLYVTTLKVAACSISNILIYITTAGATLTAGQCGAAIYQNGVLVGKTASQSTAWLSTGLQTMAILGGPVEIDAGEVVVVLWYNGTTGPTLIRGSALTNLINAGNRPTPRFGTADSSITTTPPATLGTISAAANAWWAALS